MDDREMLELAAQAACFEVSVAMGGGAWINDGSKIWPQWNPLNRNGDALELAFALGMCVDTGSCMITFGDDDSVIEFENVDGDIAKLRRAIVTAAAEIGIRTK